MKKITIMRGLPGSGKSHLARKIKGVKCSADDFFTDFLGRYKFDASKIRQAHDQCRKKAEKAMKAGKNVVIDNTNTQQWEYAPYIALAEKHGYQVEFKTPETPWAWDAEKCAEKNRHGVPLEVIEKMLERFEH